jgi:hypothetical protein
MNITTVKRYVKVWKQLLFVFWAEEDNPDFRPLYILTVAQQTAIQTVRDKIKVF